MDPRATPTPPCTGQAAGALDDFKENLRRREAGAAERAKASPHGGAAGGALPGRTSRSAGALMLASTGARGRRKHSKGSSIVSKW